MRKILIALVVLAGLYGGYRLFFAQKQEEPPSTATTNTPPRNSTSETSNQIPTPPLPPPPADPEALLAQAKSKLGADAVAASELLTRVLSIDPVGPHGKEAAKLLLPIAARKGDVRQEFTLQWRLGKVNAADWRHLEGMNASLLSEKIESKDPDTHFYPVVSGDTLKKIAVAHQTTVELIQKLNKLKDDRIKPGQRLKILPVKGHVSVEIHKSEFSLYLLYDGNLLHRFPVGIGQGDLTPEGTFRIKTRLVNPDWNKEGQLHPIPAGDPENILGTRWLGFGDPGFEKYGIHGTTHPETIGQALSNGCIRMRNGDVEEIYPFCVAGTIVAILK